MKENPRLKVQLDLRRERNEFRDLSFASGKIDLISNDYLGLARNRELQVRIEENSKGLKIGSTGSRLLSGNGLLALQLEEQLAEFFGSDALLFNSGYAANQGVLSSVPQKNDVILYDELSHACIKDGARLSMADKYSFKHNDVIDLQRKLEKYTGRTVYVVVESIYSMDGDQAPLEEVAQLCETYDAFLMVDEAHSVGVYGKSGEGLVHQLGLMGKVWCVVYTFGKAFGAHGAAVVGSSELREYLINFSRPFIYTTALPGHSAVALSEIIKALKEDIGSEAREALFENIDYFKDTLIIETGSKSAIQPIVIGDTIEAKRISHELMELGFDVRAVLSPTVPKGTERLRVCLHSFNTKGEIELLTKKLNEYAA